MTDFPGSWKLVGTSVIIRLLCNFLTENTTKKANSLLSELNYSQICQNQDTRRFFRVFLVIWSLTHLAHLPAILAKLADIAELT